MAILVDTNVFLRSVQPHHPWRRLVVSHAVSGLETHDARIVAAMLTHGIAQILTFNGEDFRRYKEITVLRPQSILSARGATS